MNLSVKSVPFLVLLLSDTKVIQYPDLFKLQLPAVIHREKLTGVSFQKMTIEIIIGDTCSNSLGAK
jgi:hypothetical protein